MTAPGIQWIDVQFNAMQSKRGGIKNPVRQFKAVSSENTSLIWEKKGNIVGFVSCTLMHQSSDPFEGFLFFGSGISSLTLAAGNFLEMASAWRFTPKSRLSYPLYRWGVRSGRSSICHFLGEFLKPVGCKTKKLQKKRHLSNSDLTGSQ